MRRQGGLGTWLRRALAAGLVGLASVAGLGDMAAQTPPPDAEKSPLTAEENEAIDLLRAEKLLTARTRADELLQKDPDSIVGHYVMGTALREAEGALARALAHFRRARELYETQYGTGQEDGRPWRLYADILFAIANTTQLMEDFEGSLRAMDDFDSHFSPHLLSQRVWPLMKLGRFDEARDYARRALETGSAFQKMRALNGLCAVEGEQHNRLATYDACIAVYRYAKDRLAETKETDPAKMPPIVVYANNAHIGALAVLKYDEAEQLAIDGTKSREETSSNPWLRLARLYMDEGRAAEAVSATKALQAWRVQQPPSTREQFRSEDEGAVAELLLIAGEADAALRLADRILERPDRRAMTSTKPEQTAGANALLRHAIVRVAAELAAERATYVGWKEMPGVRAESARLAASAWPDAQRVVGSLLDEERLVATLRIYLDSGIEYVPTWMLGDLVDVLGAGVFLVALDEARRREQQVRGFDAFYDALEAEARLAQGNDEMALLLARKALDALPKAEVLFKARVAAIGAQAARRTGDLPAALGLYERAMLADPGVVRRLGLHIPVHIEAAGGELVQDTASLLRRSPRLADTPGGFPLTVREDGHDIEVCLRTALGAELGCARAALTPPPKEGAEAASTTSTTGAIEPPQRAAEAFHKTVFALKMNLSESDLRSLDGGTTATRDAAREKMRDLLGEEPAPEKSPAETPSPAP